MINPTLLMSIAVASRTASANGLNGQRNAAELLTIIERSLNERGVDANTLSAEVLATFIDVADDQRQTGFREGVQCVAERGHSVEDALGGYDSTEDRCDRLNQQDGDADSEGDSEGDSDGDEEESSDSDSDATDGEDTNWL